MEGFGVGICTMLIAVKSQQTKTDRCITLVVSISCLFLLEFLPSGPGRLVNPVWHEGKYFISAFTIIDLLEAGLSEEKFSLMPCLRTFSSVLF
jgi:hypothetical protein